MSDEPVEITNTDPILTKEIGGYGGGSRNDSLSGFSVGNSPTRAAQETIRQVLGWRYRGQDTKGFLAALNRAFDLKEVEGHTEWSWKPQNYMVQADLGEITGAQASIFTRAKVAVEHALPLLDGLTPLREDADADEMEAVRSIIRNALNELLREFGAARGPRVQRVDGYFEQLLGSNPNPIPSSPETVLGYFGILRNRFGLERLRVNTIVEEQNLTNSLILVDYVISLKQTWEANRRYFDRLRTAEPFLGTQLVLLSQALETIAESVHEAYDAMDSVFFSAIERQTTNISFQDKDDKPFKDESNPAKDLFDVKPSPMTIAELFGWVEDFVTSEARQLIQDAGKDGVVVVRRTLRQLRLLLTATRMTSELETSSHGHGFYSSRVRQAFKELEAQLRKAYQLAVDVRPAVLSSVVPMNIIADSDHLGDSLIDNITLFGDGLSKDGKVILFKDNIAISALDIQFDTALVATFDFGDQNLRSGIWSIKFVPEDVAPVQLPNILTIMIPKPVIISATYEPNDNGDSTYNVRLNINGKAFRKGAKVVLKLKTNNTEILDSNPTVEGDFTRIIARFNTVPVGEYDILLTNPDDQTPEGPPLILKVPPDED